MLRRATRGEDGMNDNLDDRYERRLVEETSRIRVEVAGVETRLTERMAKSEGGLRQEVGSLEVRLIDRIAQSESTLRGDIGGLEIRMERSLGALRADLCKWSFVFWLGQVAAMTGILAAMLPR